MKTATIGNNAVNGKLRCLSKKLDYTLRIYLFSIFTIKT